MDIKINQIKLRKNLATKWGVEGYLYSGDSEDLYSDNLGDIGAGAAGQGIVIDDDGKPIWSGDLLLSDCEDYTLWTSGGNITLSNDTGIKVEGDKSLKIVKAPLGSAPYARIDLGSGGKLLNQQYNNLLLWIRSDVVAGFNYPTIDVYLGVHNWDDLGFGRVRWSEGADVWTLQTWDSFYVYPEDYYNKVSNMNNIRYINIKFTAYYSLTTYTLHVDYIRCTKT